MEGFYTPDWKDQTKKEKIITIVSYVLVLLAIITIIVQMITKKNHYYFFEPMLITAMILQTIQYWKYNRLISIVYLISSIFLLIVFLLTIII